jgi:hypothetical protein
VYVAHEIGDLEIHFEWGVSSQLAVPVVGVETVAFTERKQPWSCEGHVGDRQPIEYVSPDFVPGALKA